MEPTNTKRRLLQRNLLLMALHCLAIMYTSNAVGQSSLKGNLCDSLLNTRCQYAVVALLRPDSTLVQFTRSGHGGTFFFDSIIPGKYLLLVSHPSYLPFYLSIEIKTREARDLLELFLPQRVEMLAAAIVVPRVPPPKMNGDTLEYNTAGIKTRVNATVEELLTHLQGVEVDRNGVITVNGERVDRLLVDGQDFFGSDPRFATRNLNADMIAKIQVINRKSDQSQFTGMDDGQRTRTLNLSLKEGSKHGYFSNTRVGGSTQGYYKGNGFLGDFNGPMQLAALAAVSNTGTVSSDNSDAGTSLAVDGTLNDPLGASAGTGIPRIIGGGTHYADQWNVHDVHLQENYSYFNLTTDPASSFYTRQVLPDSIYVQQRQSRSSNMKQQHNGDLAAYFNIDSLSNVRISIKSSMAKSQGSLTSSSSSSLNDALVNSAVGDIQSKGQNRNFQGEIMWSLRVGRRKRNSLSVLSGLSNQRNYANGFIHNKSVFFTHDTALQMIDTIDQRKNIRTSETSYSGDVIYVIPINKIVSLASDYAFIYSKNSIYQETYAKDDGKYQLYIDSLSNQYRNDVIGHKSTLNIQINTKSIRCSVMGSIQYYDYKQRNLDEHDNFNYQYINFSPKFNGHYTISHFKGIIFDYNGGGRMPSILQLQPVQNNNDPLHIVVGNPGLKPVFVHNGKIVYYLLKSIIINIGMNFSFAKGSIGSRVITDSLGRQLSQPVNLRGSRNIGLRFSFSHRIKPIDLSTHMELTGSYNRDYNYVSQYLCKNDRQQYEIVVALSKRVLDRYSVRMNSRSSYSNTRSSINVSAPLRYWTENLDGQLSVYPTPNCELGTSVFYDWRQKINDFGKNNSSMLWNAQVNWSFLKNRLNIKWQVNDILQKNNGIKREVIGNQTVESLSNVIGRYWMLTASYRFVHHR